MLRASQRVQHFCRDSAAASAPSCASSRRSASTDRGCLNNQAKARHAFGGVRQVCRDSSDKLLARAATFERRTELPVQQTEHSKAEETYCWTKQWYPLAAVKDLDPSRPHADMLLGKKIVLWRDKDQQWRCFEDECPHRRVPLSEGRIEPSSGTLMCGYHGWTFAGDGRPVNVPQMKAQGAQAEQAVRASAKACATVRPTQVRQGLLFVWGESSSSAAEESKAVAPPLSSFRERVEGEFIYGYDQYLRDLPGGFEVWLENMQDQSHVAFAHHSVTGSRGGEKEGYFRMHAVDHDAEHFTEDDAVFKLTFDWSGNGSFVQKGTQLYYKPPCLINFATPSDIFSLYIYAVPLSAHRTRLIINAGGRLKQKPLIKAAKAVPFLANLLRVAGHLQLNQVNQGDIVFMTGQHRAIGRTETGPAKSNYFLPCESDRGTATWLSWLRSKGGGGPRYPADASHLVKDTFWDASGRLDRHEMLDIYNQHTARCSACQKALGQVRGAQTFTHWALRGLFLLAAVLLGGSQALRPLLAAAGAAAALLLLQGKLEVLERQFVFTDWVQADLK